ncbi:MAG: hypothetical protein ACI8S6_000078 [Myxococcota bacterium]
MSGVLLDIDVDSNTDDAISPRHAPARWARVRRAVRAPRRAHVRRTPSPRHLLDALAGGLAEPGEQGPVLLLEGITGTLRRPAGEIALGPLWRPDGRLLLLAHDQVEAVAGDGVAVRIVLSEQPPEAAPLPGRFRPRLLDEGSGLWLGSLAGWSALATALLIFAWQQGPPPAVTIQEIPDRFVDVMLNLPPDDSQPPELAPSPQSAPRTIEDLIAEPSANGLSWGRSELARRSEILQMLAEQSSDPESSAPVLTDEEIMSMDFSSFDDQLNDSLGGPRSSLAGDLEDARIGPLQQLGADAPVAALANRTGSIEDRVDVPVVSLASMVAMDDTPVRRGPPGAVLRSAMKLYRRQVRHCYEVGMKADPNLSGRISLELDIEAGVVTAARIAEDTSGSEALGRCLLQRASRWSFPEDVSALVEMPFAFN